MQPSSLGHYEDGKEKALELCVVLFSKRWHLWLLFFFLSSSQSAHSHTYFTYLYLIEQVMFLTVTLASKPPSKLEHHDWPRFQSVHHLARLGFFPVMFSFVYTML